MHDAWEASLKAPSTKIENIRNLRAKVLYFKNVANFKLLISFSSGKGLFYRCLFNNLILKVWFCLLSTLSCCQVTMQMMQNTKRVAKTQQKSSLVFLLFFFFFTKKESTFVHQNIERRKTKLFIEILAQTEHFATTRQPPTFVYKNKKGLPQNLFTVIYEIFLVFAISDI